MKLNEVIRSGFLFLKKHQNISPQLDAELLLSKVISKDRKYLFCNENENIDKKKLNEYNDLIKCRSLGKPIAHLLNKKDFWKNEFYVTSDVLVPRPDTEIIIEEILSRTKFKNKINFLDIGAGSGCIILSILKEKIKFSGVALDICKKSLKICKDISNKFT